MENLQLYLLLLQVMTTLSVYAASRKNSSKKILGLSSMIALATAMVAQAWYSQTFADGLLLLTCAVWLISISRLLESKQNEVYVKYIVLRDSKLFLLATSSLLLLTLLNPTFEQISDLYVQISVVVALLIALSTIVSLKKYHFDRVNNWPVAKKLPTVTLAIPARNETHALQQCLESALTSNYEKIEILVLDDCSQDATAEMIRSFAHDGIRFVQGTDTADGWIGKNQAYKTLLEQASGDIVIFCGVDVHLSVDSISQLVNFFLANKLKMMSVLPMRQNTDFKSHILQPVRHFWQFAFPRFLSSTPAVISSCWMVERKAILKIGGFDAVSNSLNPEAYFAKKFNQDNAYSYALSDYELGINTQKQASSQADTALRTLYPTLKRSFALSWFACLAILSVFIAPFFISTVAALNTELSYQYIIVGLLTLSHVLILTKIAPASLATSLITFPLSMVSAVVSITVSAIQYEYGEISWKGRNICIPALQYTKKD